MSTKTEKPQWAIDWDDVVGKYPISHAFKYLGITMFVTFSEKCTKGVTYHWAHPDFEYWTPGTVCCEYVNYLGEIKSKVFKRSDIKTLKEIDNNEH
jgi:hypothetical protein